MIVDRMNSGKHNETATPCSLDTRGGVALAVERCSVVERSGSNRADAEAEEYTNARRSLIGSRSAQLGG